ncbi:MAG: hypothetical protein M1828_007647 [Chrysothrix sp. TS-e1954]|nr:MAG: hypothetical protein M1828_007647 [Chrysothrix sp. TS-e1954]
MPQPSPAKPAQSPHRFTLPTHDSPPRNRAPRSPPRRTSPRRAQAEDEGPTSFQRPPPTGVSPTRTQQTPGQFRRAPRFSAYASRSPPALAHGPLSASTRARVPSPATAAAEGGPRKRPRLIPPTTVSAFGATVAHPSFNAAPLFSTTGTITAPDPHGPGEVAQRPSTHPRFQLPPSTPNSHALPTSTSGLNPNSTTTTTSDILLPHQFSPQHKRGRERFVEGGWADALRGSLLELSSDVRGGGGGGTAGSSSEEEVISVGEISVGFIAGRIVRCATTTTTTTQTKDGEDDEERAGKEKGRRVVLLGDPTSNIPGRSRVGNNEPNNQGPGTGFRGLRIGRPSWCVDLCVARRGGGGCGDHRGGEEANEKEKGRDREKEREEKEREERGRERWTICPTWRSKSYTQTPILPHPDFASDPDLAFAFAFDFVPDPDFGTKTSNQDIDHGFDLDSSTPTSTTICLDSKTIHHACTQTTNASNNHQRSFRHDITPSTTLVQKGKRDLE